MSEARSSPPSQNTSLSGTPKLLFRIIKTERPKPTFHAPIPFIRPLFYEQVDRKSSYEKDFEVTTRESSPRTAEDSCFGITSNVSHTSNFNIYRGESVHLTLVLLNASSSDLGFVSVLVRLQTSEGSYCLLDTQSSPNNIFTTQASLEYNLQFVAKVVGNYALQCFAFYTDVDGQEHTISQSYRFTVHLCLNFIYDIRLVEEETDWEFFASLHPSSVYIVDCFIYNVCQLPVYLHEVHFLLSDNIGCERGSKEDQNPSIIVKDLNIPSVGGEERTNESLILNPGDCQTFTYLVYSAIEDPLRRKSSSRAKNVLGSIYASFTRFGGDRVVLDPALTVEEPKMSQVSMVTIEVVGVPSKIVVECPFVATMKVVNRTSQSKKFYFQVRRDKVGSIVPIGVSGRLLETLQPNQSCKLDMQLIALEPGAHFLSGFRVVDVESREYYEAASKEVIVHSVLEENIEEME
ncbi:uncharacterized protein Gasu_11950 [Galdieria sulphuraria]|uniref:Uncharacterized protein n=1 Tax=Galdieria sulphuraria TaxID=130081 RepID=M2Y6N5_GALSU|nr:uncharacterized protein Gasu_11950 [Galdieria sulphuraria]EME31519.1 hypothetical protein Gasu_11950 [Galdieria sulphuraria]|eukprot:XP_005708039.1 hypothetical protein Gasu_11950 [Galdieria sulphuraria]